MPNKQYISATAVLAIEIKLSNRNIFELLSTLDLFKSIIKKNYVGHFLL